MNAWTNTRHLLWSDEDQRLAMFNVSHALGDPTRDAPPLTDDDAPEAE